MGRAFDEMFHGIRCPSDFPRDINKEKRIIAENTPLGIASHGKSNQVTLDCAWDFLWDLLWDFMRKIAVISDTPWVVIRDFSLGIFNVVYYVTPWKDRREV